MVQSFRLPGPTNFYNPVASRYVISFVRKKDEFPLNRYVQLVEAPAPSFFYYELDRDQSIRVRGLGQHVWADGAKRPMRRDNQFGFREVQNFCVRYDFNSSLGNMALEMGNKQWDVKAQYLENLGSQAMTARTLNVWRGIDGTAAGTTGWTGLDNPNTWPATNVADVNTLNGAAGPWNTSSADEANVSYMAIKKALNEAATRIFLNTNGRVKWKDLRLCISPNLAKAMANTAEIREWYKYGPYAKEAIEGAENLNAQYGLPPDLYNIEIVVEDSMYLTDLPTAGATAMSTARQFIKNDNSAVLLCRPGKIDAQVGPSFSTVQLYWFGEQLTVEEFSDPIDRLTEFHVVDNYVPVGPALVAGFLIQNCLA